MRGPNVGRPQRIAVATAIALVSAAAFSTSAWAAPAPAAPVSSTPAGISPLQPSWGASTLRVVLPGSLPFQGPAAIRSVAGPAPRLPTGAVARVGGPPGARGAWMFSPDGRLFVAPSNRGTLSLFDSHSRESVVDLRAGIDLARHLVDPFAALPTLSFRAEAKSLALYSAELDPPSIRVLSTTDGSVQSSYPLPPAVRSVTFDPTGRWAVLQHEERAGNPLRVSLLDLDGGTLQTLSLPGAPNRDRAVAVSADATLLVVSAPTNSQQTTGATELFELPGLRSRWSRTDAWGDRLVFSPTGAWLAVGSHAVTSLLSTETGELAYRRIGGLVAFAPDDRVLLESPGEGWLSERNADGSARHWLEWPENDQVRHAVFAKDGEIVAAARLNEETYFWERATGRPLLLPAARMHMVMLAFSEDATELVGYDGEFLYRWSARDGRPLDQRRVGDTVLASAAGQRLLALGGPAAVQRAVEAGVGATLLAENRHLELSESGTHLLVTSIGGSAVDVVVDLRSGRVLPLEARGWGSRITLSPNGERMAFWSSPIELRDTATGALVRSIPLQEDRVIGTGSFSHDGKRVVALEEAGAERIWLASTDDRPPARAIALGKVVTTVEFSPDDQRIAVGYVDGMVELRTVDPSLVVQRFEGHREAVYALAFSPDGKRLVSASTDGSALVWRVR